MSQTNLFAPGDTDNNVLRKILNTLQFGLVQPDSSTISTIVNNQSTSTPNTPGNVGGYTSLVRAQPTVTSGSAYAAGNTVGGIMTLGGALRTINGTGIFESFLIFDQSNQKQPMTLFLFNVNPTNATTTDKQNFAWGTNYLQLIAQVNVAAADYTTTASQAVAQKTGLGIAVRGAAGNMSLYAVLVTSGTPTWATTNALNMFFGFLQD